MNYKRKRPLMSLVRTTSHHKDYVVIYGCITKGQLFWFEAAGNVFVMRCCSHQALSFQLSPIITYVSICSQNNTMNKSRINDRLHDLFDRHSKNIHLIILDLIYELIMDLE